MDSVDSFLSSTSPLLFSTPLNSPSWSSQVLREEIGKKICLVCDVLMNLVSAIVMCIFAIVGLGIGAAVGGVVGLAMESNLQRGAKVGAISGAAFFIEVVESSLGFFNSRESGLWSLTTVMHIISMQIVVHDQRSMTNTINLSLVENANFLERDHGMMGGLSRDAVEKLPTIKIINTEDRLDGAICCSVCLQDFQAGETVRSLPQCRHTFHLPCIDNWLIRHSSCPLCRRNIL